jgi:hypothetical protein
MKVILAFLGLALAPVQGQPAAADNHDSWKSAAGGI